MNTKLFKLSLDNGTKDFVEYPDECPECHQLIDPTYRGYFKLLNSDLVYIFLSCPSSACAVGFAYEFQHETHTGKYKFKRFIKGTVQTRTFSKHIESLSPGFSKIYKEAETAENFGLNEISGVGYRKSLEFLIKDYLMSVKPENEEQIKKSLLGKCIKDYVANDNIKSTAKRAAWLGNDETHYVRLWEDKDLKDLKLLINLTMHWIEMELLTKELIDDMPEA